LPDGFARGIFVLLDVVLGKLLDVVLGKLLDVVLGKLVIPRRVVGLPNKPLELERLGRVPVTTGVFDAETPFRIVVRPKSAREVVFDGVATLLVPKIDFLVMGSLDV